MTAKIDIQKAKKLLAQLSPEEIDELDEVLLSGGEKWVPLPGPQSAALECEADILFYGGSAGGGKTDLIIGTAVEHHERSIIYRRESTQLQGIFDRMAQIVGGRDGFNSKDKIWRLPDCQVEFGSVKNAGDEEKYQGRAHDLKCFDEICHFLESQFRFLCGWMRSDNPDIRQRIICTGNPPTSPEGEWVRQFWGPWLDKRNPMYPYPPGELLWYTTIGGKDHLCDGPEPFERVREDGKTEIVTPKSRTFIPSSVRDNIFLMESGYESTLQAMPEPLRSKMLYGDFSAGMQDHEWQVIPTSWVEAAQARWKPREIKGEMDSLGVDVARGDEDAPSGDDNVLAPRYGTWFDELIVKPGNETPTGPDCASFVIKHRRDHAPVHIDVIGVGSSPTDFLKENGIQTIVICGAHGSDAKDSVNGIKFANKRAELYWKLREALDPVGGEDLALPPDQELLVDLCAPRWSVTSRGILVESKKDIKKRIQRSPNKGDAVVYGHQSTPKVRPKDRYEEEVLTHDNYHSAEIL